MVAAQPIAGGDICRAFRVETASAGIYFAKTPTRPDPDMFTVETAGLRALSMAVPGLTPQIVHHDQRWLVLEWVEQTPPELRAASRLGRDLARLHQTGAPGPFGSGPDNARIASLPMSTANFDSWAQMYAEIRLRPLLTPELTMSAALVEALLTEPAWAGVPEPPSLLHGDLWAGNVLWARRATVIDPAVHVGHRETDLAMLALFGAPLLEEIVEAYEQDYPLASGWRQRVGLHQMWPLLVHHRLFAGGYGQRAEQIAAGYVQR